MPKGKKISLCLNANITDPEIVRNLSKKFKVQLANQRADDIEIIEWANKVNLHIITRNTKHYWNLFRSYPIIKIGVIGINTSQLHAVLPKLEWLLSVKVKYHEALYKVFYEIDLQGYKCYNKKGDLKIKKTKW